MHSKNSRRGNQYCLPAVATNKMVRSIKGVMRYFYVIGKPLTKQSMLTIWLEPMSPLSYSEILINTMKEAQIKTMVTVRVRKQNMIRVPFVVIWFVFADLRGKVIRCSYPCSCKFYSAVQSIFLLYRQKCFSSLI